MEMVCKTKYWCFPASHHAAKKRLYFYVDDKLVYDLVMPLDFVHPTYEFPLDVQRFAGKTVRVECDENLEVSVRETDTWNDSYDGLYRPLAHFTAKRGWINDPNGLVYYKGRYHMFFQHNPVDVRWENMHWGHAVSADLIHWEEKDIAIFPDEHGTIFSGSAIVDWNNVTGLKQNENDVILLYYTYAGNTSALSQGQPFTQNLAYSVDGGETFVKYPGNPLIGQVTGGNRDPKVIYYEPDDSYIMAFFLDDHTYVLYKSKDLLRWDLLQNILLKEDGECPDFFPLAVDGDAEKTKWVFMGASDRYYVGDFDGRRYTNLSEPMRLNYGNSSYAAQSWSDLPDGRRIRTAFSTVIIPGEPYGGCMIFPQELRLRTLGGKVKLCAQPIPEIEQLYLSQKQYRLEQGSALAQRVTSKCCDIRIKTKVSQSFSLKLFGFSLEYRAEDAVLKCLDKQTAISGTNGEVEIRLLIDTVNSAVFADEGSVFLGMTYIQDENLNTMTVTAENAAEEIAVSVAELKAFWE